MIAWEEVIGIVRERLAGIRTRVIICLGTLQHPPREERNKIISDHHDTLDAGHRGRNKTVAQIRQNFKWEHMKEDVADYIRRCVVCQTKRLVRPKTRQPMLISYTPAVSLDRVAIDLVGPFVETNAKNKYILTVQDQLTKYSLAIPLKETTSCAIADAFIKNYISYFGSPRVILSDNGSNLVSTFMKRIAKKFKILQIRTTPYHPEGNASIERHHHVLVEYIKKFVGDTNNWDEFLHLAAFSYNTHIQDSTRFTPYELVFGRLPRVPSASNYYKGDLIETYESYLRKLIETLNELQGQARINSIRSK